MKAATYFDFNANTVAASCRSHCKGQCTPACSTGGHCVDNVSDRPMPRPRRQDMLNWALLRTANPGLPSHI